MKSALASALLTGLLLGFAGNPLIAQDQPAAVTAAAPAPAEVEAEAPPAPAGFSTEQLEQLVAPIALHPDALLMQILMAATYPLEVVEADRWAKDHPDLSGTALEQALLDKDWDPSVKSLCSLPSVLAQMSENLDWTQDLGDAFLEQQNDLLDTVQRMRGKAYEAGNLKTSEQQQVTQQPDQIIVIESSSPEVIYVPTYSPTVVYGAWSYPSYYYPPMYYPPPPGYGLISFGIGMAVGAAIWGDCNWGWGHNDVNINVNRYNEFNRTTNINADRDRISGNRGGNNAGWQHDSSHRKGVNYKNSGTAQKYGGTAGSNRVTKDQARGRGTASASNRAAGGAQAGNRAGATAGQRPSAGRDMATSKQSAGTRPSGSNKPAASTRPSGSSKPSAGASSRPSTGASASQANRSRSGSGSAYSGSRNASADRMSSSRGASSRGSASYGGGSRGGTRGGGGRRR